MLANQLHTTKRFSNEVDRPFRQPTLQDLLPLLPLRLKEIGLDDPIELFLYANNLPISLAVRFSALEPAIKGNALRMFLGEATALTRVESFSNLCVMTFASRSLEVRLNTVIEEVYLADLEALMQLVIN
jgi:hypothetical protein